MRVKWAALVYLVVFPVLFAQEPGSSDSKQRVKFARSLAKSGAAGIAQLRPYLEDVQPEVRRAAVDSIVAIGGAQSLEPLTLSLKDGDPGIQKAAINGLVNFYLPGYYQTGWRARIRRGTDQIIERFTGPDDPVVPAYVNARPEIVDALGELAATSAALDVRAAAVRALGVLRATAASEQILAALATKNTDVLYEVMTAFEKIRNTAVAPRLFYLLRDPDERVQLAAIQTVSLLGNKDANEPLREAWNRTKSERVRRALLEAMAMLPAESNRPLFEQHILHQDEYLRAAAAEGLGRLGNPDDRARLGTLWEGELKMRPRLSLAFAAVALGNKEISELSPLQYLINTLNHVAWRGVAQGFLKDLAADSVVRYSLHNALLQGNRGEKIALAGILGTNGGKESVEVLESLSHDTDAEVASQSLRALRTLRLRLN